MGDSVPLAPIAKPEIEDEFVVLAGSAIAAPRGASAAHASEVDWDLDPDRPRVTTIYRDKVPTQATSPKNASVRLPR